MKSALPHFNMQGRGGLHVFCCVKSNFRSFSHLRCETLLCRVIHLFQPEAACFCKCGSGLPDPFPLTPCPGAWSLPCPPLRRAPGLTGRPAVSGQLEQGPDGKSQSSFTPWPASADSRQNNRVAAPRFHPPWEWSLVRIR